MLGVELDDDGRWGREGCTEDARKFMTVNDIIIWSSTVEKHIAHVQKILVSLKAASLFCNAKKCKFF
jgi:hypothetical protein